ncbi:MAG: toll/interleukin-1 receptor domain-containing protein [Rhodobiaceae bacterium]|nr:toll/interleukin-1 receptor domain-containing protein [Rhodobiaceae bacterium]
MTAGGGNEEARAGQVRSVFLSYRRDDTAGTVGRVHDRLKAVLPDVSVFLDVDDIAPGRDFAEAMFRQLAQSDVVLVFIGKAWEAVRADGTRRIDDAGDHVRQEVAAALAQGHRVIPVLADRATMPGAAELPADLAGLPRLNACALRHTSFAQDLDRLFVTVFGVHEGVGPSRLKVLARAIASALAGFGSAAAALLVAAIAHRELTGNALNTSIGSAGTVALMIAAAVAGAALSRWLFRRMMKRGA